MKIKININNNILNEFNNTKISDALDNYIINELKYKPIKNKVTLVLVGESKKDIENIIRNYYKEKYNYSKKFDNVDNYIHITLFIIGLIAILISEQFKNIFSEIFLIAGWVVIWEVLYDILFNELKRKRTSNIYKALASCEFEYQSN